MNGWLALSPLAVFLVTYLVTSIVSRDFYKVPVSAGPAAPVRGIKITERSLPRGRDFYFLAGFTLGNPARFQEIPFLNCFGRLPNA